MSSIPVFPSHNSEGGSMLLDVPLNLIDTPEWLRDLAKHEGYKAKDEYHVTIIGLHLAQIIKNANKDNLVKSLIENTDWTIEVLNQYVELAKDDDAGIHRQSIICIVEVPQMSDFFQELEGIIGTKIKIPPAHVTLYTKNYDRGIGLYSGNDLLRFRVRDLGEGS